MGTRARQLSLLRSAPDCFGGSLLKNSHAKSKRPVASRLPMHLVLKGARGGLRRPGTYHRVDRTILDVARKHGVRIYERAVAGNHAHLVIKLAHVRRWAPFIRELTGRIALAVGHRRTGASFWAQRPFTRVIRGWRRAFVLVKRYVQMNELEAQGLMIRAEARHLDELRRMYGFS